VSCDIYHSYETTVLNSHAYRADKMKCLICFHTKFLLKFAKEFLISGVNLPKL